VSALCPCPLSWYRPNLDPFARLSDNRARAGPTATTTTSAPIATPTTTAPLAVPSANSGFGFGGLTPANSYSQPSPLGAPTPANSYQPVPGFPAAYTASTMGGAAAARPPYGAPAAASPFGAPTGAFGGPASYGGGAPFGAPATGGFGAPPTAGFGGAARPPAAASNDPFGAVNDPFGPLSGGGDILVPQSAVRAAKLRARPVGGRLQRELTLGLWGPAPWGGAAPQNGGSAEPVVVAGGIVDLSASSLARSSNSKNPFGSTGGKHQWDKPKPQMSLNEMKQSGAGGNPF